MNPFLRAAVVAVVFALASTAGAADKRPMKLDDMFAFKRVAAPQISPDGKRMVYVTYPLSVPAASHPHNQRVTIREQEVETGKVRVLAYLYGGQGTMNVPSWSPDGKHVAFVSYTYGDPSV